MVRHYRHLQVALLRATARQSIDQPRYWPHPADSLACAEWLRQVWLDEQIVQMIGQASPVLAASVARICSGETIRAKKVRSAAISVSGYLVRAAGHPTPFGLFAGVAPVQVGGLTSLRWGHAHRAVARPDTEWVASVVTRLESCPDLLPQIEVVCSDLAQSRGGWVELQHATDIVRVRETGAVRAVRDLAAEPVPFGLLASEIAARFDASEERAAAMLTEMMRRGLLITSLHAPFTVTDPLDHVIDAGAGGGGSGPAQEIRGELTVVRDLLRAQNSAPSGVIVGSAKHEALELRMRRLAPQAGPVLAVDLALNCQISLPERVLADAALAAEILLRLSRHRDGLPAWREYLAAFLDRYGTGLAVPLTELVAPGTGLGFPAGYPGSAFKEPEDQAQERDHRLLGLAWATVISGDGELALTDEVLDVITSRWRPAAGQIPPHVEVAVRICADSPQAIDDGAYTLVVSPARAGGVLTSRFTPVVTGSGLEAVYRSLPTATEGALAVQLSFPPAHAHAENVSRVPAYLPHVLSVAEHRQHHGQEILRIGDLAVTASAERLYLMTRQGQVVEPQVFHALNLDRWPPPIARFLAQLSRAFSASWGAVDWGPGAAQLPYLPRVRYGRSVLALARWKLRGACVPPDQPGWQDSLAEWRSKVRCPQNVDLRDNDRTLPLDLGEPMHAEILRHRLTRRGDAIVTEPAPETRWIGGHAHEIAVTLAATTAPAPSPMQTPILVAGHHGHLPAAGSSWLYAKVFVPADWHEEILTDHVPILLAGLSDHQREWFIRYRSAAEADHLRLRLHIADADGLTRCAAAFGQWASSLREAGLVGRVTLDTYYPETGRYGGPAAMPFAEKVFAADSHAVIASLQAARRDGTDRMTLAAQGMIHIACGLLGPRGALDWFAAGPVRADLPPDPAAVARIVALGRDGFLFQPSASASAADGLSLALAAYRQVLPAGADTTAILRSLLHMHHNRLIGIDPAAERTCRYLAWRGCVTAQARGAGGSGP